jgi:predicted ArsR family transcriptional regulator
MRIGQSAAWGIDLTAVRAIATLEDPSRRALYGFIRAAREPITREQAASAVGISRKLAAFHLDKLVKVGLLVADYHAAARSRALGRIPKAYRPADIHLSISVPERKPAALAALLIDAVRTAGPGESAQEVANRLAYASGRAAGAATRGVARAGRLGAERALTLAEVYLREAGFEPARVSGTYLRLRNCPYQPLADQAAELVCGLNQRQLSGFLDGLQARAVHAVSKPRPAECCVELRASVSRSGGS